MLAICLTAAWPWPRKATYGCFHVFASYRTKSGRHVLRLILLNPQKKIVPGTDYRSPGTDLKNEKFKWKIERNNPHVHTYDIYIYEYEYFGSARTPVTKSSTRDHTASLFYFLQRTTSLYVSREYAWKNQKYLVSYESHKNTNKHKNNTSQNNQLAAHIDREAIHECSYTRERIMSSVSLYSSILWVTATIPITTACVHQMVPKTR